MKKGFSLLSIFLLSVLVRGANLNDGDTIIYLFPGQGADARQFKQLELPPGYDTVHISYPVPEKRENIATFTSRL